MDARTEEIRAGIAGEHGFANFHRSLCDRFGYTHDAVYWWRDLVSLEEHIAKQFTALREEVQRLKGALNQYGRHDAECPCIFTVDLCTCGFAAALSPSPAQQEPK